MSVSFKIEPTWASTIFTGFFPGFWTLCMASIEAIHRVQNPGKKPVKIVEAQVGSILKETDIVRYQDVYGRVK